MTPTDAMVEKVGLALVGVRETSRVDIFGTYWDDLTPEAKDDARTLARAAISAYESALNEAGLVVVHKPVPHWAIDWSAELPGDYDAQSVAAASPAPKDTKEGE